MLFEISGFEILMIMNFMSSDFCFASVNYLDNWKCIAVMKGDGSACQNQDNKLSDGSGMNGSATIPRYTRLGNVAHGGQLVRH